MDEAKRSREIKLRRDIVTAAIEKTEERIEEIDGAFCKQGFFESTADSKVKAMQKERTKLGAQLERLMAEWEELEGQLDEQ